METSIKDHISEFTDNYKDDKDIIQENKCLRNNIINLKDFLDDEKLTFF